MPRHFWHLVNDCPLSPFLELVPATAGIPALRSFGARTESQGRMDHPAGMLTENG